MMQMQISWKPMLQDLRVWNKGLRLFPLLLAGCLALISCADLSTMSPAEQAVERSKRRFLTTTVEGAAAGAVLGAALGAIAGGGRGALIGAAAGGVAGAAVAQNNFQRSQTEGNLNAAINDASQQASLARQDAQNGQAIAVEARAKVASLRAQLRAGQITAAQYNAGLANYKRALASLQEMSKGFGDEIASMRTNASLAGRRGASLNQSATDIEQSKAGLDRAIGDLYATTSAEPA